MNETLTLEAVFVTLSESSSFTTNNLSRSGLFVITTLKICSANPGLRFYTGSHSVCGVLEVCHDQDLEIRLNIFCWLTNL